MSRCLVKQSIFNTDMLFTWLQVVHQLYTQLIASADGDAVPNNNNCTFGIKSGESNEVRWIRNQTPYRTVAVAIQ